jgi:hypothetical protein
MMQVVAGLSTRYFRGSKVVCDRFSSLEKFYTSLDVCRDPGLESVKRLRKEGCGGCCSKEETRS